MIVGGMQFHPQEQMNPLSANKIVQIDFSVFIKRGGSSVNFFYMTT